MVRRPDTVVFGDVDEANSVVGDSTEAQFFSFALFLVVAEFLLLSSD